MVKNLEEAKKGGITRRNFLAASAACAAALAATSTSLGVDNALTAIADELTEPEGEGVWKTMACLQGCGGRCMNQAFVKDGIIVRQKTDDTHIDSLEYPQQRGCLRGRMLPQKELGIDRLKYPMKRKSWTPENPNGELRGRDEWERISWDEALDIVADQIKKVYTEYGPRSVYRTSSMGNDSPVLQACGGYISSWDSVSMGTYVQDLSLLGLPPEDIGNVNDRLDLIENADLVVLYGQNPAWSAIGNPTYFLRAAQERGAEFVFVGPDYNMSAAMLDAKWIRVLPGSDTAFLLGVAHEMIALDKENPGLIDWDFLHTHCVGFDAESMPSDAKTKENFRGYVLGEYDGVPKTVEWASAICGTPQEDITWFAQAIGKDVRTILSHGYGAARCNGAEDLPQLYMTIACMGGHFGKPGHACGNYFCDRAGSGGEDIIVAGDSGVDDIPEVPPLCAPKDSITASDEVDRVSALETWSAILDGTYTNVGDCWEGVWTPREERTCDIKYVFGIRDGSMRAVPDINKGAEALRSVDFVVMQHFSPVPTCSYADVILPVLSNLEYDQMTARSGDRDREMVMYFSKISDPIYDVKTDQWIEEQLAKRLGYDPKALFPLSEEQQFFNQLAGTEIMEENGDYSPLLTITAEDITELGAKGKPQKGKITLQEFKEKGIYQVERKIGDAYTHIAYADFIEDPEKNPLPSASGKFEIYSQAKADTFNSVSFAGETYKPYPTYQEFSQEEDYPFLSFNPHYPRATCSEYNNVVSLREAWSAPLYLSSSDAKGLGLKTGDAALISSPHGSLVRTVSVNELIMPGTVGIQNGSWAEFDKNGVDHGGNPNVLYGGKPHGMGVSGYNNVSVKIEKWTGGALAPDYEHQVIIDAVGEEA